MSASSDILHPYKVEWNDFNSAFAFMDDPAIGLALVEEPKNTPSVASLLTVFDEFGRTLPDAKRIAIHQYTSPDSVDVTMHSFSGRNTLPDISADLAEGLVSALHTSITLRREIIARLMRVCPADIANTLRPYDTSDEFAPRHPNVPVTKSRIDYIGARAISLETIPNLHCDATVLTDHGGATQPALKIIAPGTHDLVRYDIPAGFRLLSRGIHWQLARTPEHVPLFHSAAPLNIDQSRARWVLLWRAYKVVDFLERFRPQQIENCSEAREEVQSLIRAA